MAQIAGGRFKNDNDAIVWSSGHLSMLSVHLYLDAWDYW